MGKPVILVENFFSRGAGGMFPNHTISAEEEPAGFEAFRVARASRTPLNYATATTANSAWYLRVTCDRVRGANCVVLDRGHNLAGKTVTLYASQDNFATNETVFSVTLPTATGPGSIDDGSGVRTEEGAWIIRFPMRFAKYWEFNVSAMGAGLKPQIVGLWLGMAWEAEYFNRPWSEDAHRLIGAVGESDAGWRGRERQTRRREFQIQLELPTSMDYEAFRYHLDGLFGSGWAAWIVFDSEQGERAVLADLDGPFNPALPTDYGFRAVGFNWIERDPLA